MVALDEPRPGGPKQGHRQPEQANRRSGESVGAGDVPEVDEKRDAQQAVAEPGQEGSGEQAASMRKREDGRI
jgi:hypothetical protein